MLVAMKKHAIPEGIASAQMSGQVLPCLLDIGEAMIVAGGDVNMVERLLRHVGYAYGAAKMNVLVITASVIITMTMPDGLEHTQTRRIESAVETDFAKLEKLSRLCRTCIKAPLLPNVLKDRFEAIKAEAAPRAALYLGGVLSAASFAVFFGGSLVDGAVSAVFALLVCFLLDRLRPLTPNTIVFNFIASLASGLGIGVATHLVPGMAPSMVTIGVIMLLIPGVAMTNAIRDMIAGDTISGVMRLVESLLWATSLALGFMVAMWLFGIGEPGVNSNGTPLVQIATALPASLGFALFFNVRKSLLAVATLGGVLTEGLYLALYISNTWEGVFIPTLIAAGFAAVYAEALSHRLNVPTSVLFIIAVIPLIPGRGLYYTMQSAVLQSWTACGEFALLTAQFASGIAIGIVIVWAIVQTWQNIQGYRQRKSAPEDAPSEALQSDELA